MDKLISYYGFSRIPFGRDLAPSMLHRHGAHNEAVARIGWCVADRRIGVVTGEVGAGKTVAVRAALTALDRSRHAVIYLPDPTVGVRGIHHRIVASLGGQPLTHHATLAPQAADALAAEQAERGRTPVVVVEEAHLLGYDQLEALRLLTNHDLDSSSPFACLLIGQPTLRRRMKLGVLAALDQRIGLRYAMPPMTDKETASYLRHHLALAGRDDTLFSDDAVTLVHQTSRGYPRAVNNLALQALLAAFAADKTIVDATPPDTSRRGHFMPTRSHRQRRHHAHPECRSTVRLLQLPSLCTPLPVSSLRWRPWFGLPRRRRDRGMSRASLIEFQQLCGVGGRFRCRGRCSCGWRPRLRFGRCGVVPRGGAPFRPGWVRVRRYLVRCALAGRRSPRATRVGDH
ncbi:Conserved protein of unknown function [Mycobacterium canettii CIPT 140070017]|nr:Conserved protein of unknown function [Mycobacterium canettii CIPT 140070017]